MPPDLIAVTPLARAAELASRSFVLVSYEEWSDQSVLHGAAPGTQEPGPPYGSGYRLALAVGDVVVAWITAGGGGHRGGLNSFELCFAPGTPFVAGLALVRLDEAGEVVERCPLA